MGYSEDNIGWMNCYPCKICQHNDVGYEEYEFCTDCKKNLQNFIPAKKLIQFLNEHNYNIVNEDCTGKTHIILGFPGVGASYFTKKLEGSGIKILDTDKTTYVAGNFPTNYVDFIKSTIGKYQIVFTSFDSEIADMIYDRYDEFKDALIYVCYPSIELEECWVDRLRNRGNGPDFCNYIYSNFRKWIIRAKLDKHFYPIVITSKFDYISNHLNEMNLSEKVKDTIRKYIKQ